MVHCGYHCSLVECPRHQCLRLQTIVHLHEEKTEIFARVRSMREWVLAAEPIFDGSWASHPEEVTNEAVTQRFDAYLLVARLQQVDPAAFR